MFLLLCQTLQKVDSLHFCWHSSALETKKESSTINLLAMQDATGTRINKNGMLFCIKMMTVAMTYQCYSFWHSTHNMAGQC